MVEIRAEWSGITAVSDVISGSAALLAPLVRDYRPIVFQSNILLIARPTLRGVLPPEVSLQFLARHLALRKISQSLRAGAIFSCWIGVFGPDGSPEFALELIPTFFRHSRHLCLPFPHGLPFPHAYGGYRLPLPAVRCKTLAPSVSQQLQQRRSKLPRRP